MGANMFGGKTRDDADDGRELNTILGKGSVIEGKITIKNSVRVDGRVVGEISSTGTITVGEKGEVEGDIIAQRAVIGGKVKGTISASLKTILESQSVFIGDLSTAKLTIDEGAMFEGRCLMTEDGKTQVHQPVNVNNSRDNRHNNKHAAGAAVEQHRVSSS